MLELDEGAQADAVWARRVRRTGRPSVLVLTGFCAAAGVNDLVDTGHQHVVSSTLLVLALVAAVVVVNRPPQWSALPLAIGVIGVLSAGQLDPPVESAGAWWPSFVAAVLGACLIVRFAGQRWTVAVAIGLLLLSKVVLVVALLATGRPVVVTALVPQFAENLAVVLVVAGVAIALPALAHIADQAELPAQQRRLLAWLSSSHNRLVAAARRRVHDETLVALRLLADGRTGPEVRRLAGRAINGLTVPSHESNDAFVDVVAVLREVDRSDIRIRWRGSSRLLAPLVVATAMADSLAELLRNVSLHAGVGTASVSIQPLRWSPGGFRVTVEDQGRGFDPVRARPGHVGLSESVTARVREVGGRVVVRSRPGAGTSIRLTWRLPPIERNGALFDIIPPVAARPLVLVCSIVPALNLVGYLVLWGDNGVPLLAVLAAAVLVVGTVLTARTAAARGLTGVGASGAIFLSVAVVVSVALAIGPGPTDAANLAIVGPAAAPVAIVCAVRPPREGALGTVLLAAVVGWMVLGWVSVSGSGAVSTLLTAPLFGAGMGWVLGMVFDLLRSELGLAKAAELQRRQQALRDGEIAWAARDLVDRSDKAIVELLRAAADGAAGPDVVPAATQYELAVRDTLALHGCPQTLSAVARLRAAGWACTLLVPPSAPEPVDGAVADLLLDILSEHTGWPDPSPRGRTAGSVVLTVLQRATDWHVSRLVRAAGQPPVSVRRLISGPEHHPGVATVGSPMEETGV